MLGCVNVSVSAVKFWNNTNIPTKHQSLSSPSSAIVCLNLFQSSPAFHDILECISYTQDDTLLVYCLGALAGLTLLKSDFFDWVKCSIPVCEISKVNELIEIETTIHKKKWHQETIFLLTTSSSSSTIIHSFPFQSSHLSSELKRKEHHLWRSSWDSSNQNCIDIPIDVFKSNSSIIQKSVWTEAE